MIAIIDYEAGNLYSVRRAFQHLGVSATITDDEKTIRSAERIVIPGVGRAGTVMSALRKKGLDDLLRKCLAEGKYILGICIGIQIIFEESEEDDVSCLGLLEGRVARFSPPEVTGSLKVPQMGWNAVAMKRPHPLFEDIDGPGHFYFVNSYYPLPAHKEDIIGETTYGVTFASAVARGRLVATQFHLEKSGPLGLTMLRNFCTWKD